MAPDPSSPPFPRTPPGALPELMDRPDCDQGALRDALETIDRAGRWSGRDHLVWSDVARLLRDGTRGDVALLDVGAGAGHGTLRLARRLASRGWHPRVVIADLHAGALRIARERLGAPSGSDGDTMGVDLVRLTGAWLPFRDGSFDIALCSNTLHHLARPGAVRLISELARVSRRGFVVVDLRRSRLAYAATRLAASTLWRRRPYPRHDGPASVRRAFTPEEAAELLRSAGLGGGTVRARTFWIALRWRRVGRPGAGDGRPGTGDGQTGAGDGRPASPAVAAAEPGGGPEPGGAPEPEGTPESREAP